MTDAGATSSPGQAVCVLCGSPTGERIVGKHGCVVLCRDCVSTMARQVFKVGRAETCPDYEPAPEAKPSLAYHEPPRFCGLCTHYDPNTASCTVNPSRIEMVCTKCGAFILETPGRWCPYCGSELAPVTGSYGWVGES